MYFSPGKVLLAFLAGALVGFSSFGHVSSARLALAVIVPILWFFVSSRGAAFALFAGYYLAASRGIPASAPVFFHDMAFAPWAWGIWLASSATLALPWALLWSPDLRSRSHVTILRLFICLFSSSVPPLATFGWGSPLLAVGWFFPAWGWAGLLVAPCVILILTHRFQWALPGLCFIILVAFHTPSLSQNPQGFSAIYTHFGFMASGSARFTDAFIRSTSLFATINEQERPYILLPETVAGMWNKAAMQTWAPMINLLQQKKQTLIVGAEIPDSAGRYDNVLLFLGTDTPPAYKQRMPVPLSMWKPWGGTGTAKAYWWDNGIVTLADGRRAAVLLCYEQYLSWPFLRSMMGPRPDLLITAGNQWWSDETIQAIEHQSAVSWARLFGLPLISAVNK